MKMHLFAVMTITTVLAMTTTTWALGLDTNTADLPPNGEYVSPQGYFQYTVSGLGVITVQAPVLSQPSGATRLADGDDEIETFDATLSGVVQGVGLVQLTGQVEVRTTDRLLNTTGTFTAEIISASFIGNLGGMSVTVQEDPGNDSMGQTEIIDIGGGLYHINSFFDVYTELTIDGGNFITAPSDAVRMNLVPEPATLSLLVLGGLAVLRRRRS